MRPGKNDPHSGPYRNPLRNALDRLVSGSPGIAPQPTAPQMPGAPVTSMPGGPMVPGIEWGDFVNNLMPQPFSQMPDAGWQMPGAPAMPDAGWNPAPGPWAMPPAPSMPDAQAPWGPAPITSMPDWQAPWGPAPITSMDGRGAPAPTTPAAPFGAPAPAPFDGGGLGRQGLGGRRRTLGDMGRGGGF